MQKALKFFTVASFAGEDHSSFGGGSKSEPVGGWSPGFCVSKSMLNAITRQFAYELKSKSNSVNANCPVLVRTDMGRSAPGTAGHGAETIT
jgi:NAD(P)-dependent dehydrogenase (short-subunit alcohol dehydrogenase family)